MLKRGVLANLAIASFAQLLQAIRNSLKIIQHQPGLIEAASPEPGTDSPRTRPNRHRELGGWTSVIDKKVSL